MARTRWDDWFDFAGEVLDGVGLLACGIIGTLVCWVTALYAVDALWPGPLPEAAQWLVLAAPFVALLVWANWPRSAEAPQVYEPHRFYEQMQYGIWECGICQGGWDDPVHGPTHNTGRPPAADDFG